MIAFQHSGNSAEASKFSLSSVTDVQWVLKDFGPIHIPFPSSHTERIQTLLESFFDTEEERKRRVFASRRRGQNVVSYWRAELSVEQAAIVKGYKYVSFIPYISILRVVGSYIFGGFRVGLRNTR